MRSPITPMLIVAGFVLAGCGDSSSDDISEPAVSQSTTASTVSSAPEPVVTEPAATEPTAEPSSAPVDSATTSTAAPVGSVAAPPESAAPPATASEGDASTVASVCDLLTTDDLRNNPFFVDEPVAEGNDYGEGFLECVWTGDFEKHEVRVSIIPLAAWEEDFGAAVPLDLMGADIGGGELYDSLLGIGRVGSGTTAVYFVGDVAILSAVRTGEDGSLAADRTFAVDLGQRIVEQL